MSRWRFFLSSPSFFFFFFFFPPTDVSCPPEEATTHFIYLALHRPLLAYPLEYGTMNLLHWFYSIAFTAFLLGQEAIAIDVQGNDTG